MNCPTGLFPMSSPEPATAWKSYVVDAFTGRFASRTVVPNRLIDDIDAGDSTAAGDAPWTQ